MITKSNRLDVVSTILRMHRDAEQFSGFSMAQGAADDLRIDDEKKAMERWMRVLSKSFEKDFRQLAALLGYGVEKIEPDTEQEAISASPYCSPCTRRSPRLTSISKIKI
jgi:hypothetical protein